MSHSRLGSDPAKVFPRKVFLEHLKRFGNFGLVMSVICLPIFTSNAEDVPELDLMAEKMQEVQDHGGDLDMGEMNFTSSSTRGVYDDRITGVIRDMHDLGYI